MKILGKFCAALVGLCLGVGVAVTAAADTVYLTNGDRISGTVTKVADGKLIVTTEHSGEVTISLDHVKTVETAAPVAVRVKDQEPVLGKVTVSGEAVSLEADGLTRPIVPADIAGLAPSLEALTAQEAAAAKAVEDAKPKIWSGSAELGMTFRSGERDTFDATSAVTVTRTWERNVLTLKLNGAYGEAESTLNTQKARGELKWQYQPEGPLYYYLLTGAEHDDGRKLEFRGAFGGGVGRKILDTEKRKLSLEGGAEYSYERWENFARGERRALVYAQRTVAAQGLAGLATEILAGTRPFDLSAALAGGTLLAQLDGQDIADSIRTQEDISLRVSMHYEQSIFNRSKLMNDLVVLPQFEDPGDFRVTNELAFTTPINESLSLRLSLKSEYDNDPGAGGVDKFDNTFLTGLRYQF